MNNFFRILGLCLFIVLGFFYTEKVAIFIQSKNPVVIKIKELKNDYQIKPVNSVINNNTIIPGINGLEVNIMKSFQATNNEVDPSNFVYNQIIPSISLKNNKDKIIIKGNSNKKEVALIIENNQLLKNYLSNQNISYNTFYNRHQEKKENEEYINYFDNDKTFNDNETLMDYYGINKHICLVKYNIRNTCLDNNMYLVKPNFYLSNNNISLVKENIGNGSVIYIKKDLTLVNLKIILNQLKYQGLKVVFLSNLISEENTSNQFN